MQEAIETTDKEITKQFNRYNFVNYTTDDMQFSKTHLNFVILRKVYDYINHNLKKKVYVDEIAELLRPNLTKEISLKYIKTLLNVLFDNVKSIKNKDRKVIAYDLGIREREDLYFTTLFLESNNTKENSELTMQNNNKNSLNDIKIFANEQEEYEYYHETGEIPF